MSTRANIVENPALADLSDEELANQLDQVRYEVIRRQSEAYRDKRRQRASDYGKAALHLGEAVTWLAG